MNYLPIVERMKDGTGKHIFLGQLPPPERIAACILHDDASLLRGLGLKELTAADEQVRFSIFYSEIAGKGVLFVETGMGTAQTSVVIYELAAYLDRRIPVLKVGTCGLLHNDLLPGLVFVSPSVVAAEGVSLWNRSDSDSASLLSHVLGSHVDLAPGNVTAELVKHLPEGAFTLAQDRLLITTDALYALYNKPSMLAGLADLNIGGKRIEGIEMELSALYSTCRSAGLDCAAFIVGSWTLDQQLNLAEGQDARRPDTQRDQVHQLERQLVTSLCDAIARLAPADTPARMPTELPELNGTRPPEIEVPGFLHASLDIGSRRKLAVRSTSTYLPLLAEGYAYINEVDPKGCVSLVQTMLACGKVSVVPNSGAGRPNALQGMLEAAGLHDRPTVISYHKGDIAVLDNASGPAALQDAADDQIFFVLPDTYLLRRYLHSEAQKKNKIVPNAIAHRRKPQEITFIGVGPHPQYVTESLRQRLREGEHVVCFDRTLANVFGNVPMSRFVHVVPYDYEEFSRNLDALNSVLRELHAKGLDRITVLTEGNPEVYDFAEGLSTGHRAFRFEASASLIYISCRWLEGAFGLNLLEPSYVLLSGFNARHGVATDALLGDIDALIGTEATLLVMEMYSADMPTIVNRIVSSPAAAQRSLLVLNNMFSMEQRVSYLPRRLLPHIRNDWIEELRARFTTLVVVDDRKNPTAEMVLRKYIPSAAL